MSHLDDGALVRILDGQTLPEDLAGHVEICPRCRARLARLDDAGRRFSAALVAGDAAAAPPADLWQRIQEAAADRVGARSRTAGRQDGTPEPRRAPTRAWRPVAPLLRAAAIVGLVMAGALTAQPVRLWVSGAFSDVAAALGWWHARPAAPAPPSLSGDGVVVEINPARARLGIRVDAPQAAGAVEIRFEERATARGELVGDAAGVTLVALPDGFRIENITSASASYRFVLPASLDAVSVTVAGGRTVSLTPGMTAAAQEIRIPLRAGK